MNESNFFPSNSEKKEIVKVKFVLNETIDPRNGEIMGFVVSPSTTAEWGVMEKINKMYPLEDDSIFPIHERYLQETVRESAENLLKRLNNPAIQKELLKLADEYEKISTQFYEMDDSSSLDALGLQAYMEEMKDKAKMLIEGESN